jgi:plasmid stabilization system protein ParE
MSLAVIISEKAELDLTLQYRWYLQHADVVVAERYLAAFDETIQALTVNPELGRSRHF